MGVQETPPKETECSHCESVGEIGYSSFQRQQNENRTKVFVKNLPEGISESGLKNLFLSVGEPVFIRFLKASGTALVEFSSVNEVELAIRDLNCKPPYNLKVAVFRPRCDLQRQNMAPEDKQGMFSKVIRLKTNSAENSQAKDSKDGDVCGSEVEKLLRDVILKTGYDPSLRIRQRKLDFRTDWKCVSKGRGFLNMGDKDRFVGGLQKFKLSSEYDKDEMSFSCANCQSRTVKMCGRCSVAFCCKACLTSSSLLHQENCLSGVRKPVRDVGWNPDFCEGHPFPAVTIESGSTVVISSYFTVRTVYVRQCDELWGEKFSRLCNEVAEEAIKGHKLDQIPSVHDLVIARYYEDLCFYRAQVCAVAGNTITVFFIDFGNTQETRLEDLNAFPDRLGASSGFAVKVKLKDVSEVSSLDAVKYLNELTAESTPLVLKSDSWAREVVLVEKDSNAVVNETVSRLSLPSWRKDSSASSKSEEIFSLDSIGSRRLEIDKCYSLRLSHFDEKEFSESEVFWMVDEGTDDFLYAASEMSPKMADYCAFTKGECYLPRENELCLAEENGKWHRCVNLNNRKTACLLFFLDDGHSSLIETKSIRRMAQDFAEIPSQSICCTLPDNPTLKHNEELHSQIAAYLRGAVGLTIHSVRVLKQMGDAYCLSIPEVNRISQRTRENLPT